MKKCRAKCATFSGGGQRGQQQVLFEFQAGQQEALAGKSLKTLVSQVPKDLNVLLDKLGFAAAVCGTASLGECRL